MSLWFVFPYLIFVFATLRTMYYTFRGRLRDEKNWFDWVCLIVGCGGILIAWIIKWIYYPLFKFIFLTIVKIIIFVIAMFSSDSSKESTPPPAQNSQDDQVAKQSKADEERRLRDEELEKRIYLRMQREEEIRRTYQTALTDVVKILTDKGVYPFFIDIRSEKITITFKKSTQEYVFKNHQLPSMTEEGEKIFARDLNQRLGSRYELSEMKTSSPMKESDGTINELTTHSGTRMSFVPTKTF